MNLNQVTAIIFDLDQTLVDSKHLRILRDSRRWSEVYKNIDTIKPYSHINEIIHKLIKRNYKIAVVSSSPSSYCKKVINNNKWNFNCIVGYHDTRYKKPHPEPILFALKKMNASPSETLSLGDRAIDIIASNQAETFSGACLWDSDEEKAVRSANPTLIFNTTDELETFLNL